MKREAASSRRVTRASSKHFAAQAPDANGLSEARSTRKPRIRGERVSVSTRRIPPIAASTFGLIQERVADNLYFLLVAAMLWNRTKGSSARPVFLELTSRYPRPDDLAQAEVSDLIDLLSPIGLQNQRAHRLIAFARAWKASPPHRDRRYRRLHYPAPSDGLDVGKDEVLDSDDPREGWEVAHLPGMGPYALDSFRIFHRDVLRGLASDWNGQDADSGFEPEWKRVTPTDKELKVYIKWMWLKEGWICDSESGSKVVATRDRMRFEKRRSRSASPQYEKTVSSL